ncbi:hypothetical protein [Spirosoma radiotolerans]|uniref:Periplasmic heavy metal sensor n=1 Tax=Spirosoma radiotolerans TaxID=1379870 RepID=A0A0E3ZWE9_9BACT|nr:hypothetical protein [Spirosoma radiotolerans]AKD55658.1 hypothetical protein SD10_12875 [Spirosoma radiotolerans]
MNKVTMWLCCLALFISLHSFGQYGGYGGGYGRGGYGGGMGQSMPSSPPRASVPNIAGDMAQKETKWLKENLELTKEQAKSVKQLNNEYASQQQDAIKDIIGTGGGRPSPETIKQVKDVMLMFNEEKEEKLKPILTPEQWTLYQSKKEAMQKEIGGWRPAAPKKDSTSRAANQG